MSADPHTSMAQRLLRLRPGLGGEKLEPNTAQPRRRRYAPDIETGPLVAGAMVIGVPLLVWLALILGSDGVRNLGATSFGVLVFVLFAWGFIYEVNRLSRLP
ncbi:hypothetical protein ABEG18_06895 [Alsobacter sp. KACC 23698]|uniref:Uncharacterized protein n=1 Tax=Alsobacter sp. KACC 23698 TaxID=3149229 RepID=A0AAU7JJA0_9HYPH